MKCHQKRTCRACNVSNKTMPRQIQATATCHCKRKHRGLRPCSSTCITPPPRALHIEDQKATPFYLRRGIPQVMYSDCGTTFVGADKELKKLFSQRTKEHYHMTATLMVDQTQWKFNPPAAPHMGGKWEAAVKSIKFYINRSTRDTPFTIEEISTLLTQIEAILNSRPLQSLTDNPDDCSALTPGHFLIGGPLNTLPDPSANDSNLSMHSKWQGIQQRVQQFRRQWTKHYLQQYLWTSKWHNPNHGIKVGSLVLITDQRIPPCEWPLGRVLELHPARDGLTRVVILKTAFEATYPI
ncbi:PREDICTED: uncharacterized protein LOC105365948 [Ceratosolen solmsi marchali]|uniref:Uncharacterized protein LOC105365948 n=1 Tax=Ceratosolen solmsi marchali TaxID=326594 RepID=A0AAJ6YQS8_9HYME|nr:PREDICTED: uncharacterized protein LOC105365948 [Ceratosolen solmsi marchali]